MPWPPLVSGYVEKSTVRRVTSDEIQGITTKSLDCKFNPNPDADCLNQHIATEDCRGENNSPCPGLCQELDNRNQLEFQVKQISNMDDECLPKCREGPWPDRVIMSPPFYGDIGKQARDIFGKGYHFGLIKLDFKTKTPTGVEFSTGGVSNKETGTVFGTLESKYKFKDYGVTFTEKWNTDNVIATEVVLADFCEGTKVGLDASFAPFTGDKACKLKGDYKNDMCAVNLTVDFKKAGARITPSAVMGYKGWLFGYQAAFDSEKAQLVSNKLTMGFVAKDFIVTSALNEGRVFSGSIYHRVNKLLETGVQVSWTSDNNETDFGIGCKYELCEDASLGFKVNNKSLVGIRFQQKLNKCVSVYLSTEIDGKNFNEGGHKVGFALEVEA